MSTVHSSLSQIGLGSWLCCDVHHITMNVYVSTNGSNTLEWEWENVQLDNASTWVSVPTFYGELNISRNVYFWAKHSIYSYT